LKDNQSILYWKWRNRYQTEWN